MEKLNMHTQDMAEANIEKIGQLFPNCLTERLNEKGQPETAIDFDKLKQELSKEIVEGNQERYQFTWPGKREAIRLANTPTNMALRPCREDSVDFDKTGNLYIEGDNLEVLKLLRENYLGGIKCIYIDPPYNTGNDFVYADDFSQSAIEFKDKSGMFDENGHMLLQNYEINNDSKGRFHSDWLSMMYSRLKASRDLLSEDGVIFISIDDNEVDNLKKLCDEIFGSQNFVANIIWHQGRKSAGKTIAVNHEYCIVYAKSLSRINELQALSGDYWKNKKEGLDEIYSFEKSLRERYGKDYQKMNEELKKFYKSKGESSPVFTHKHYSCIDEIGIYFPADASAPDNPESRCHKQLIHPKTGLPCPTPRLGWRYKEETLNQLYEQNRFHFGLDHNTIPCIKRYLKETEYEVAQSVIYKDGRGATGRLMKLFDGNKIFDFPKDEEVIASFLKMVVSGDTSATILDFFSGSGTTAHAVMSLNKEDNGNRKFILVQLPETIKENTLGLRTICDIGKERIRRVGKILIHDEDVGGLFSSPSETCNLDTGFRVLKLDTSNMQDVYYKPEDFSENTLFEDNVKPDRSSEDLLFQVMLECNLPLSAKIEKKTIAGKEVFNVNDGYLLACFDEDVNETVITEVAKQKPYYFIMRDKSLSEDNVADNFEQIFNAYSKDTIRKIL